MLVAALAPVIGCDVFFFKVFDHILDPRKMANQSIRAIVRIRRFQARRL